MIKSKLFSMLTNEYEEVAKILYANHLLLDNNPFVVKNYNGKQNYDLTWSGKSSINSILFDENKSCFELLSAIRPARQYSFLMYDKSIIQVEYQIKEEEIIKARLLFIKLQNKVWSVEELQEYIDIPDILDEVLNEEVGFPIMIRIDFDPQNHVECEHPKAHFVFNNVKDCRIPMKSIISLSKFIDFLLKHFYNIQLDSFGNIEFSKTITDSEAKMVHINW